MAVTVNVFVNDTQVSPAPIAGVVVNVYDGTSLAFITSGTTDSGGQAAFLLPGASMGQAYELRFFKSGVIFTNPMDISVLDPVSPPNTNDFDTTGTVVTIPVATDPRMCRCTGQFIDFGGRPVPNTLVQVLAIMDAGELTSPPDQPDIPPFLIQPPIPPPNVLSGFQVPKVLDGKMVSPMAMEFRTDNNGKVSMDLIRGGQYYVTFAGEEDVIWNIVVPDRSSVNLIDLVHPEPKTVTWDQTVAPGNVISVAINVQVSVPFSILFSNFFSYSKSLGHIIQFTNSDGTIGDLVFDTGNGAVAITGRIAGTMSVTVGVVPNLTPVRVPPYAIAGSPLVVTVTP